MQKKPFSTPTLTTYGDVTKITLAIGNKTITDGGQGNTSKTE